MKNSLATTESTAFTSCKVTITSSSSLILFLFANGFKVHLVILTFTFLQAVVLLTLFLIWLNFIIR